MRRQQLALGAGLILLAGACSSGGHPAAAPTTTATTQVTPNPDVIPAVITPAYVNAVFVVLNHIYGNATRSLVQSRQVTADVRSDLQAIFAPALYSSQVAEAQQSLAGSIDNVRSDPGDGVTVVQHLIGTTPDCIFVETSTDLSTVLKSNAPPAASEFYELTPKGPGDDPDHLNPTPWVVSYNVDYLTVTSVPNKCA